MNTTYYPSLELCKKLTEIGFPESFESWTNRHYFFRDIDDCGYKEGDWYIVVASCEMEGALVCPSVMEMLDVMPQRFNDEWWFHIGTEADEGGKYYLVRYRHYSDENKLMKGKLEKNCPPKDGISCNEYNLANALAEMIFWLHENKYISFTK